MGNSLNKIDAVILTNNSGQAVSKGDVVIIDKNLSDSFTVTGSSALANSMIGVVLEQGGIASGGSGLIIVGGYIPQINLDASAGIGNTFGLSSTVKKATPHASFTTGDFGQTLSAGTTPDGLLWSYPQQAGGGGGTGSFTADYAQVLYTGSAINLGLTGDSGAWIDVDAVNAAITFTPTAAGFYKVIFQFEHYVDFSGGSNGSCNIRFRITDGTTISIVHNHYMAGTTANALVTLITMEFIYNFPSTSSKTFKLQKTMNGATSAAINQVLEICKIVERIGS